MFYFTTQTTLESFPKMSSVWKYYKVCEQDVKIASCNDSKVTVKVSHEGIGPFACKKEIKKQAESPMKKILKHFLQYHKHLFYFI